MPLLTLDQFFDQSIMMIQMAGNGELPSQQQHQQPQMILADTAEDHEIKAPKKRAETWVQEETLCLVALRREKDRLFNTSKSNKHLWVQISARMREKGFDRSPTMCTDKWRNLLKEFKKARHQARGSGPAKMACYKELDELLKARSKNASYKSPSPSKADSYLQFSDKVFEDASLPFGSDEGSGRSTLSVDRHMENERHHLGTTAADPWNWRDTSTNGGDNNTSYTGRVILVKWGEYSKRIGIDGTSEAIKEAIRSAFGLRTKRAFWLEDEDDVVRSFDRDMPLGVYKLHLDEGITIKICTYDDTNRIPVLAEERTLYTEEDFREFLSRCGWIGLREIGGFRSANSLDELCPGTMYQGIRLLGD